MNGSLNMADEVRRNLATLPRIDTPSVRTLRRRYSNALAHAPAEAVLRFVRSLLESSGWAERVVAWEVLAAHEGAFNLIDDRLAEKMAQGLADWGSVDLYGVTVVGQAWRRKLVSSAKVVAWRLGPDGGKGDVVVSP